MDDTLGRRSLIAGGVAAVAGTAFAPTASAAPTVPPGELQGYSLPLSARGTANLVGRPPWHYVGDLPVAWCPFIYVDNDASLARGWFQGFPKKLGQIHQTRAYSIPSRAAPVAGPGGTFAASLSSAGRRLAEAQITLAQTSPTLPALSRPIVNLRHFPRLKAGQYDNPAVHELTQSILDGAQAGTTWSGSGRLSFLPAPGEELADLRIVRTGLGFRSTLSYTVTDLKILTGPDA